MLKTAVHASTGSARTDLAVAKSGTWPFALSLSKGERPGLVFFSTLLSEDTGPGATETQPVARMERSAMRGHRRQRHRFPRIPLRSIRATYRGHRRVGA
ncbi:MAG: hypothetical protein MZV70_63465 [Desulfobacterales bacterium]|nr:hypothetical protein [Desulfobacterales bacterium]